MPPENDGKFEKKMASELIGFADLIQSDAGNEEAKAKFYKLLASASKRVLSLASASIFKLAGFAMAKSDSRLLSQLLTHCNLKAMQSAITRFAETSSDPQLLRLLPDLDDRVAKRLSELFSSGNGLTRSESDDRARLMLRLLPFCSRLPIRLLLDDSSSVVTDSNRVAYLNILNAAIHLANRRLLPFRCRLINALVRNKPAAAAGCPCQCFWLPWLQASASFIQQVAADSESIQFVIDAAKRLLSVRTCSQQVFDACLAIITAAIESKQIKSDSEFLELIKTHLSERGGSMAVRRAAEAVICCGDYQIDDLLPEMMARGGLGCAVRSVLMPQAPYFTKPRVVESSSIIEKPADAEVLKEIYFGHIEEKKRKRCLVEEKEEDVVLKQRRAEVVRPSVTASMETDHTANSRLIGDSKHRQSEYALKNESHGETPSGGGEEQEKPTLNGYLDNLEDDDSMSSSSDAPPRPLAENTSPNRSPSPPTTSKAAPAAGPATVSAEVAEILSYFVPE